jgi:hypothetical protein
MVVTGGGGRFLSARYPLGHYSRPMTRDMWWDVGSRARSWLDLCVNKINVRLVRGEHEEKPVMRELP